MKAEIEQTFQKKKLFKIPRVNKGMKYSSYRQKITASIYNIRIFLLWLTLALFLKEHF